ncbi:MAG TPA: diguanylate cyclase [Gaiellaceae bacterium]|jgi:diguanylate cyclase (GGDEF)-like protein|nr:diguanylate cyclase [Gaiellaceae bacterium]
MAEALPRPALTWSSAPVMRLWRIVACAGFAFLVAHLAFGLGGPGLDAFTERWVYDGLELLAAAGCLLRAATTRDERAAWLVLGLGILSFTLGDICFDFVYGGNPPGVSICDVFYLAFYPACYAALALLVRSRVSSFDRSVWLDGVIAALAVSALSASVVLQVVLNHTHGKRLTMFVNLAYPVADLVLLAIVILVFALTGRRPGRAWATAGLAFGVITLADSLFLYLNATGGYSEGSLLDALWPAAMLLLAVAAWQPVEREHSVELEGRFLAATPLLCGLVALAVLIAARFHPHNLIADALAVAAILVVFLRTGVSFLDNARLLEKTRALSLTDPLTGLGNRRSLMTALERSCRAPDGVTTVFAIFDLNGFKSYNDTFGHPSGDALLVRFAARLSEVVGRNGQAFRMGGDEFCVLVPTGGEALKQIVGLGIQALSEDGDGFHVGAEYGAVALPDDAADPTTALRLADERLYAHKHRLYKAEEPSHEILLRALTEREPGMREHLLDVSQLSLALGEELGLSGHTLEQLRLAAELHDIGKVAIPDAVLKKPGALTDQEWRFVRQHTLIGQRILAGAPGMREVAGIVRATHERWDGSGYGDGLSQTSIPLAARIIAVCDAYAAMTSDRPYRRSVSSEAAVAELRRCAGSQFDPDVVEAFCRLREGSPTSVGAVG